jgi:predicted DNA-binding antitoxin AbrB/MazE fold protein
MVRQTVDAIFENGVLRPLSPLNGVPEHRTLRVTVSLEVSPPSLVDCVGILPDEDADEMRKSIEQEFERIRFTDHSTTRPTTEPIISPTSERDNLERDRRLKAIEAATRPAKVDSSR